MAAIGIHLQHWMKKSRVEGPITPDDAGDLAEAFMWEGDYARAHELADNLTHHFMGQTTLTAQTCWAKWLAVRGVLFTVISNQSFDRATRAQKRKVRR